MIAKAKLRLLEAADSCAAELVRQAGDKKLMPSDRRAAVLAILDRAGLSAKQTVEHSGPNGGPIEGKFTVEFVEANAGSGE